MLLYSLFPYHTLAFEISNLRYCRLKKQQSIKSLLSRMIEKDEKENLDKAIQAFLIQQDELDSTYLNSISKVKRKKTEKGVMKIFISKTESF